MTEPTTQEIVVLPQIDVTQIGNDVATITAKADFVRAYAESQKTILEAKADAAERVVKANAQSEEASMAAVGALFGSVLSQGPVANFLEVKVAQATSEQTLAAEKMKHDADAQKRRDEDEARTKRRRDYIGAIVFVALVIGVGGLSLLAVKLVSSGALDSKALAVVVGNIASAFAGAFVGRKVQDSH